MTMASVMGGSGGCADAIAGTAASGIVQEDVGDPAADCVEEDVLKESFHLIPVSPMLQTTVYLQ